MAAAGERSLDGVVATPCSGDHEEPESHAMGPTSTGKPKTEVIGIEVPRLHDLKNQARSISLPIIEKTESSQTKSLLEKRAKAGGEVMRLPSFKSLGIALPRPDHLLTPPHEPDMAPLDTLQLSGELTHIPSSAPATTAINMCSINQATPPQDTDGSASQASNANQGATPRAEATGSTDAGAQHASAATESALVRHSSSSSEEDTPRRPMWFEAAVEAALTSVPSSGTAGNVITVLSQSQPCPLSDDLGQQVTVVTPIMQVLQARLEPGRYIDVTHAVPPRFNMSLLPSSPMGTPNPSSGEIDYFSMTVFPKAAVALDYGTAANWPVPSSPRPVAAPDTVGVSLLERYIPPSTNQEYLDLFSTDRPSALVDRLRELSPDGGSLLFVYPTNEGASTFTKRYLGPLLDPLLRTLVGIHGLTTDISQDIGEMVAVSSIVSFGTMVRKITFMLQRLRNSPSSPTAQRKYTLIQSSKQIVQIERETWTEWWLQQEAPRIKEVVRRYYQRGSRLPLRRDLTEGGLAREVLDGVKSRDYGTYDGARDGIEVGVFVIKRTA